MLGTGFNYSEDQIYKCSSLSDRLNCTQPSLKAHSSSRVDPKYSWSILSVWKISGWLCLFPYFFYVHGLLKWRRIAFKSFTQAVSCNVLTYAATTTFNNTAGKDWQGTESRTRLCNWFLKGSYSKLAHIRGNIFKLFTFALYPLYLSINIFMCL